MLVDTIFERLEERVEQLSDAVVITHNINLVTCTEQFNNWLQNDGISRMD